MLLSDLQGGHGDDAAASQRCISEQVVIVIVIVTVTTFTQKWPAKQQIAAICVYWRNHGFGRRGTDVGIA
ncbi:Hypothetical predicted protein [Olea europaea subsp. europaea]|uniref:Uncharacterized protein n=1 Tax=Olea europaea subsp. europaea TaxID=158383 RepID=A0A8S0QJ07_OLEEU|nr:Hypothetical predicted protein [Olea europaea subsp. europaea]